MAGTNWAGTHVFRARTAAPAHDVGAAARDRRAARRACTCWARGTRSAPSPTPPSWSPRGPAGRRGGGPRGGHRVLQRRAEVRRARHGLAAHGVALHNLASLPHISSAAPSPPPPTAPVTPTATWPRRSGARARDLDGRRRHRHPGRRRLRRPRRRARRARRRHTPHPRRRARLRGAPARLRGAGLGGPRRALRRHHGERLQRQRLHPLGADGRPGVGQEPRQRRCRGAARRALRRGRRDARSPPDPRAGPRQLLAPARRSRPWSDRLPHFRMGFTPSNGEEIQSEYQVARPHAVEAIRAVRALADTLAPVLQVSEIRTIAADELWMSPQYGQATVGLHFTWTREPEAVARVLVDLEAALARSPHARTGARSSSRTPRPSRRATSAWRLRAPGRAPGSARRLSQRLARRPRPRRCAVSTVLRGDEEQVGPSSCSSTSSSSWPSRSAPR